MSLILVAGGGNAEVWQWSVRTRAAFWSERIGVFPSLTGDGEICVFENVFIEVAYGEFVWTIAHNGSGNRPLQNILAGLDSATIGEVMVDNRPI